LWGGHKTLLTFQGGGAKNGESGGSGNLARKKPGGGKITFMGWGRESGCGSKKSNKNEVEKKRTQVVLWSIGER